MFDIHALSGDERRLGAKDVQCPDPRFVDRASTYIRIIEQPTLGKPLVHSAVKRFPSTFDRCPVQLQDVSHDSGLRLRAYK